MDSSLHGFIKFCRLLRNHNPRAAAEEQQSNNNSSSSRNAESALSAAEVGSIIEVLRLLRSGFASKNTRSGEPAEGSQSSYIEGALIEAAAKNRKRNSSSNNNNNNNTNNQQQQQLPPLHCFAQDAAQVLLFDKAILNDGPVLNHAVDFMTLFDRIRRRERLLSSNQWSEGETLPVRLSLPPCFNLLPISVMKSTNNNNSAKQSINEWQQYTYLLLAASGVWSRSMSAENYLKVENMIGTWTGAFDPHELFKAAPSSSQSGSSTGEGSGDVDDSMRATGGNILHQSGMMANSSSSSSPTASSLPPTATWRMAGMLSAALTRAVAGSRQQAFTLFNKIVISTIERPPHRPAPENNNNQKLLTPLSVARFLIDASRIAKSTLDPNNNTSNGKPNSSNGGNNNSHHHRRKRSASSSSSPRLSSLAVAIANLTGLSTIDTPLDAHHLFDTSCILSSLSAGGGNTVGSEGDAPVIHTHGSLNVPVQQEITFELNGGAVPGVSVTTSVTQEVEYTATLGWARRAARAIWQNENVATGPTTGSGSSAGAGRSGSVGGGGGGSGASSMVGSGIRRTLSEWVSLAIAVRIADVPILMNSSNNTTATNTHHQRSSASSSSSSSDSNNEEEDDGSAGENNDASGNRPTVPLVIPQTVQHVTIDTSSGSDEDSLFNINNTNDVDPTSISPVAKALNKTHLQAANNQTSGIRNKPGTIAGRRLLQRSLEAVFPKTSREQQQQQQQQQQQSSPSPAGKKGRRQYPTSLDDNNNANNNNNNKSRGSSPNTKTSNNNTNSSNNNNSINVPEAVNQTVFGSEFANHLASTIKQLRLVGTADAAAALASVVGDTRAASRLFQDATLNASSNNVSSNEDLTFTHTKNLLQSWNRHRGYRSTFEHGTSEVNNNNNEKSSSSSSQQQLSPQQILLARYMGRCLEESLRHTAAVSSAIVSHSIARTCTEVPAALKTNNSSSSSKNQNQLATISSIPELKPAETTLSPGVWSVFTTISKAHELIQSTRKLIQKLVDEEEYVRVSMNKAIGMSMLDQGITKAKKNFAADTKDLSSAEGADPKAVQHKLEQRRRVMASKKEKQAQREKERQQKELDEMMTKKRLEQEEELKQKKSSSKKTTSSSSSKSKKSGGKSEGGKENNDNDEQEADSSVVVQTGPKPRPKLFTREELMMLNDDELDEVLQSLAKTEQGLHDKIDDAKAGDAEASVTLAKAELLVSEREVDLKNLEIQLERENEDYQRKLQYHLEELVESERANLHLVERHSRHAWRIENEYVKPSPNASRRRNSFASLSAATKQQQQTSQQRRGRHGDQEIDIDGFLQKDPRFAYMMDEEELENMYSSSFAKDDNDDENENNNNNKDDNDDLLSNHAGSAIVDDFKKQRFSADHNPTAPNTKNNSKKIKQKSKVGLLPCCYHKQRKLHHLQSSIAEIDHSLMGVPFSGWSAGVRQQLSIAENSVECPPSTIEDGLPDGMEWSHIVSIDTFEAGDGSKSGTTANALVDLISEAEASTLRLKRGHDVPKMSNNSQKDEKKNNNSNSNTDTSAAPLLLPPPIRSGERMISKMTGESALYVVASSVAIPKHRRHHRVNVTNEEDELSVDEISSSSSDSSAADDDDENYENTDFSIDSGVEKNHHHHHHQHDDFLWSNEQRRILNNTLRQRVNHGFAGIVGLNDTTKLDNMRRVDDTTTTDQNINDGQNNRSDSVVEQREERWNNKNTKNVNNKNRKEIEENAMSSGSGIAALAIADSAGKRKNRFIQLQVKGETTYS